MKCRLAIAALCAVPLLSEQLAYRAQWRLFDAGTATIESNGEGASLHLTTHGVVGKLHPVNDQYRAQYTDGLCAVSSFLRAEEGGSLTETAVTFDSGMARLVETDLRLNRKETAEAAIPACVHDIIGALWKLRDLRLKPGAETTLPLSDGRKSVQARVAAQRAEIVKTPAGQFRAIRHEAFVYNGVFYRKKGRLFVWLTDDERRLPVQIKVELPFYIGDVTLKLQTAPSVEQAFLRR